MKSQPSFPVAVKLLLLIAASLLFQGTGWCQEARKEFTSISKDQLKKMLDGLKYDYQVNREHFSSS